MKTDKNKNKEKINRNKENPFLYTLYEARDRKKIDKSIFFVPFRYIKNSFKPESITDIRRYLFVRTYFVLKILSDKF